MIKNKSPYEAFPHFCLRTPLFPYSFYDDLTNENHISDKKFSALLENKVLKEAIYLASPELEAQLQKWYNGTLQDAKKIDRLKSALLKYVSRISSRCTPFGLFASCAIGEFAEETQIEFSSDESHVRSTRFDMSFLAQLQLELLEDKNIRNHLTFYPNTSMYLIDDHFRYIEYTFKNKRRQYTLQGFTSNESLEAIIKEASHGKKIEELSQSIADDEITMEEAEEFIHQLIDNQILVSELELTVTGEDYFEKLLNRIQEIPNTESAVKWLVKLQKQLHKIDSTIGNQASDYQDMIELAKDKFSDFNTKYLLQTDSFSKLKTNTLNTAAISRIQEALEFFSKISIMLSNTRLDDFKKTFRKRYDDAEIPLTTVLDSEIGIPYGPKKYDNSEFLNDVPVGRRYSSYEQINWSSFDYVMQKKLFKAFQDNSNQIEIVYEDFEKLSGYWNSPDTFSTMIEVIPNKGEDQIYINYVGGSSGAYLLGRFTNGDQQLFDHVQEILDYEQKIHEDKLIAEIVHLPEARTGNILQRANTRDYEICYLGNSALDSSKQILIDDIMVSVKYNRIQLRSKKFDKEIVPKLTNAHNFRGNPLPIYEFLCDLQNFEQPSSVGFHWNSTFLNLPYLPRVTYKNLILAKARWVVKISDLKKAIEEENTLDAVEKWRTEFNIPELVDLVERDNRLLINFKNKDSVLMFYDAVKKRTTCILEEFLFKDAVKEQDENFRCNQYVISFYKKNQDA